MKKTSLPKNKMMPISAKLGPVLLGYRDGRGQPRKDVAPGCDLSELGLAGLESGEVYSKSDSYERVSATLGVPYVEVVIEAGAEASGWSEEYIAELHGIFARILMKSVDKRSAAKANGHAVPTPDLAPDPNGQTFSLSDGTEPLPVGRRSGRD